MYFFFLAFIAETCELTQHQHAKQQTEAASEEEKCQQWRNGYVFFVYIEVFIILRDAFTEKPKHKS